MRISDWSSDVCSSDLVPTLRGFLDGDYAIWARSTQKAHAQNLKRLMTAFKALLGKRLDEVTGLDVERWRAGEIARGLSLETINRDIASIKAVFNRAVDWELIAANPLRSEEHTSELQSLMRKSYADFCLKKTKTKNTK